MDIGVISMRYARALLKSATDQKLEDAVYQEMMTVAKSYLDVPALRHTIDNPMLSKDKKEALLTVAAGVQNARGAWMAPYPLTIPTFPWTMRRHFHSRYQMC